MHSKVSFLRRALLSSTESTAILCLQCHHYTTLNKITYVSTCNYTYMKDIITQTEIIALQYIIAWFYCKIFCTAIIITIQNINIFLPYCWRLIIEVGVIGCDRTIIGATFNIWFCAKCLRLRLLHGFVGIVHHWTILHVFYLLYWGYCMLCKMDKLLKKIGLFFLQLISFVFTY